MKHVVGCKILFIELYMGCFGRFVYTCNEESMTMVFDVWAMTIFSLFSHLGKLIRKPRCSPFWCRQDTTRRNLTPCPHPSPLWKPQASALPCPSQAVVEPAFESCPTLQTRPFRTLLVLVWHLQSQHSHQIWVEVYPLPAEWPQQHRKKVYYQASYLHCMLSVCFKYSQKDFIIILLFPSDEQDILSLYRISDLM